MDEPRECCGHFAHVTDVQGIGMTRLLLTASIALLFHAGSALSASTSIDKFTLAPGEKKMVTIDAKTETRVGFANEGSIDDAKRCRKTCIRMSVPGNPFLDAAAAIGTTMSITPTNDKIQVLFENLEAFPIAIDVFRE